MANYAQRLRGTSRHARGQTSEALYRRGYPRPAPQMEDPLEMHLDRGGIRIHRIALQAPAGEDRGRSRRDLRVHAREPGMDSAVDRQRGAGRIRYLQDGL